MPEPAYRLPFVLVICESRVQREQLERALSTAPLEVRICAEADEALRVIERAPPELVVADFHRSGGAGNGFARLLRSPSRPELADVPFVMVAASYADTDAGAQAKDLGASDFFPTPLDSGRLVERVLALLASPGEAAPWRVLLALPDLGDLEALRTGFAAHDTRLLHADGLAAAEAALATAMWDTVVCDLDQPGLDHACLARWTAAAPRTAFVAVASDADAAVAVASLRAGAGAHLRRPFAPDYLVGVCHLAWQKVALLRARRLLERRTLELRRSERLLQGVLDSSEQIHLVLDALGRVELFNQAAVRICLALGGEPPRRGRTVTHFLPARLAQGLELGLAAALGGRPHQHDVDLPDREGRRRRFIVRYAPLSALPDTAPQVCFNAYDITARAEAEDELRLRNHALGSISQGVVITGPDRRVTYVNDGFTEITGYSAEEVLGRSCGFLQGPDTDADFDVRLRRCLAVGAPFEGEVFNHRKDGSTFWNELTITPVRNERGDITQWVGVQRDITERKRQQDALAVSQARLQALFDHSHDAILLADDEGRFLEANPAACALLGRPRDELVGRHHALMHVAEEPLLVAAAWQDFLRTGRQAGECILRRADGSTVRAEYHAVAGIQPGVHLTIIRDVTERHALQAKVLRQQRLESVGRLASGVAHNLNNVFTPILMAPTILRAHLTDPGARMLVESIEAGARRGSTIVRHLLTFARGESGDKMPLDLRDILREVAAFIRDTFPKEIAMELSLPPSSLPFPVIGDAHQLQQAVINLALNSADAMEARGGRLVLALERADLGLEEAGHEPGAHPGPHAVISVADHGVGIAAEHLDKIFDPFFTTKPLAQGSGLGLSVVLGIVRGHGGFARVTSRPGVGTVMRLYFPLQFAPDTAPAGPAPVVVAPGRAAPVVLVVDDEAPVRDILRSILARVGCNVLCADGADAAFAQLQACGGRVDLVITDLMMPGVSGAKFIELLHGRRRDLPILVISGADAENHLDPSIRARVRGVVSKPCDVQALVAAVRRVLAEERPAESPLGVLAIPAAAAAIV